MDVGERVDVGVGVCPAVEAANWAYTFYPFAGQVIEVRSFGRLVLCLRRERSMGMLPDS